MRNERTHLYDKAFIAISVSRYTRLSRPSVVFMVGIYESRFINHPRATLEKPTLALIRMRNIWVD